MLILHKGMSHQLVVDLTLHYLKVILIELKLASYNLNWCHSLKKKLCSK